MSPFQCQMARTALAWSTADLARAAVLGIITVSRFEAGLDTRSSSVDKMRRSLEAAGVVFFDESSGRPEMRLQKPEVALYCLETGSPATETIKQIEADRWNRRR